MAAYSRNLARNLAKMIADPTKGTQWTYEHLAQALEEKQIVPKDFSLRALAEELVPSGREWVQLMDPHHQAGFNVLEAGDAVSTTHFSNITGQITYSRILDAAMQEDFVMSRLIPTQPSRLDGEKIPTISNLGDQAQVVDEGKEYPSAGVTQDYIETPSTTKRGEIVSVTKEAIFFDRTTVLLRQASAVGQSLGINKEKRLIDMVVDENTTAHRYRRRGMSAVATYGDISGDHDWDNLAASNGLVDHANVQAAELLLSAITDPMTGEPMPMYADTIICTPQVEPAAWRTVNAFQLALQVGGFATSGNLSRTDSPNPLGQTTYSRPYNIVSSRLLAQRMATDTSWFLGRPSEAFAYVENWPITVVQANENSEAEFTRDVVARYKASERGAAATINPRYIVKSTA